MIVTAQQKVPSQVEIRISLQFFQSRNGPFPEAELSQRLTLMKQSTENYQDAEIIVSRYELSNENCEPCVNELDRRFETVRNVFYAAYEQWIDLPNKLKTRKTHDNLRLIYDTSVSAIVNIRSETKN
jgi:hypothetical protein